MLHGTAMDTINKGTEYIRDEPQIHCTTQQQQQRQKVQVQKQVTAGEAAAAVAAKRTQKRKGNDPAFRVLRIRDQTLRYRVQKQGGGGFLRCEKRRVPFSASQRRSKVARDQTVQQEPIFGHYNTTEYTQVGGGGA